ncbi:hypothetical protein KTQ42_16605|uniref:hypothetical protein n=1 Tax=Noviherbaspirillum sp. L7-7A TaxID=2850560 RepID=UPI001C2C696B|nr:hypothetical protein [Noviherbaspirillum sp. L7-7A]MBV0880921.1 hypothetical protein [Noviherbaspirillum sp. L7-7A]
MPNGAPDQTMPGLLMTDIAGLAERITALRERIVTMVHEGLQTRDQSELLFSLLRALKAAKASGPCDMERLPLADAMHGPVLVMAGACRRYGAAGADGASTATGPHASNDGR